MNNNIMDIWSWICQLPDSTESDSPQTFQLVHDSTRSIQLKAQRTAGSTSEALLTFSITLLGFDHNNQPQNTIWVSDTCPLNSDKPFLPLLLQLLQEIIARSPTGRTSTTCPRSQLQKLKPDPVSWILDTHSPESFSNFFNVVFLMRLFWLCVCDAPSEVGFFYFESILGPNIESIKLDRTTVLSNFFIAVGVDVELCFMRTFGYMLTKWLILREVGVGLHALAKPTHQLRLSYATESNGFWVLKAYSPVLAMEVTNSSSQNSKFSIIEPRDSVLKYALGHQQLEAVIQLEYSVTFHDGYIRVTARVDNLRFHVAKLGFSKKEEVDYANERHFVSRARVWVGPEIGATYVTGLSLGRSTNNGEREVEMQRVVKGSFEKLKAPKVKTRARLGTKARVKNWRWDQDAEGNCVIFDAVLHDNSNGNEVSTWRTMVDGSDGNNGYNNGPRRPFTKTRGLVFAGDEYGEGVEWRLSKEMEGNVLKWRIGGEVWVSYLPNEVKSTYFETRCVQWCDEVDLPLIPPK